MTTEDFEALATEAAPEAARVRCVPAGDEDEAGAVRLLVVPSAASERGVVRFDDLVPSRSTLQAIADRLQRVRLVGTRVAVEPPSYQGVTVVARLRAKPKASGSRVEAEALEAVYTHLHPTVGGPDGTGWPFGRPIQAGEVHAVLQRVDGVDLVLDVRVFGANPVTGARGPAVAQLDVKPLALAFSYQHEILVEGG